MKVIWILGGGKFGLKAAHELGCGRSGTEITIVEQRGHIYRQLQSQGVNTVLMDGIRYLAEQLKNVDYPDWIIPAIPRHVAFEWVKARLVNSYDLTAAAVPGSLAEVLPNPISGSIGQVYVSNADFVCPQNCVEPAGICTITGKPRPRILHKYLADIHLKDFRSVVVCSQQLAPGIGGYRPRALFSALDKIKSLRSPVILSTACRCHAVMNAFTISRKKKSPG